MGVNRAVSTTMKRLIPSTPTLYLIPQLGIQFHSSTSWNPEFCGSKERNSASANPSVASDPNNAFYWKFQEFGTARHPAAPFLRPAYDAKEDEAARVAIAKALENFDKVLARG